MRDVPEISKFSKRELEVIRHIAQGKCRKVVADELRISIHTIDAHLRHIHLKTKTHSLPELIIWTYRHQEQIQGKTTFV